MEEYRKEQLEVEKKLRDESKRNAKINGISSLISLAAGVTATVLLERGLLGEAFPRTLFCLGYSCAVIFGLNTLGHYLDYRNRKEEIEDAEIERGL